MGRGITYPLLHGPSVRRRRSAYHVVDRRVTIVLAAAQTVVPWPPRRSVDPRLRQPGRGQVAYFLPRGKKRCGDDVHRRLHSQHPRSLDGRVSEGPQAPTTTRNAASPGTSKPDWDVVTRLRVAEINPPILSAAGTTMPIAFSKRESIELQQDGAVARVRSGMSQ
jgi:hypothetical protein